MGYAENYANNVSQILQQQGNAQADARLRSGQGWASALGQIGQTIAQIPQQIDAAKARAQEGQLRQAQIGEITAKTQQDQAALDRARQYTDALKTLVPKFSQQTPDGKIETDDAGIANALSSAGFGPEGQKWLSDSASLKDKFAQLQKATDEHKTFVQANQGRQLDTLADIARTVKTPTDFVTAIAHGVTSGVIDMNSAQQWIDAATKDPTSLDQIKNQIIQMSPSGRAEATKLREAAMTPMKLGEGDKLVVPGTGQVLASGGDKPKSEWDSFQDTYAKTHGVDSWSKLHPGVQAQAFTDFATSKQDPVMRDLALQLKQIQIGQQPTQADAAVFAKQLVEHKLAPSQVQLFGGFGASGAAFKRMIGNEALKIDPNFDWEQSQSDYDYGKTPGFQSTVRFMDAAVNSIPRLLENAKKLDAGHVKSINALIQAGQTQFQNVDLKKLKTDVTFVGDEIAKVLQGGGTGAGVSDAKLKQAQDIFATSDDPAVLAGAAAEAQYILANRRSTLIKGTYLDRQNQTTQPVKVEEWVIDPKTGKLVKKGGS